MAHEILTLIPDQIVAGTQVDLRRTHSDFNPGVGWTMTLYVKGGDPAAPIAFSKAYTGVSSYFDLTLTPTETATLTRGNYKWEERVALGTERQRADYGILVVLPDIATATATSLLSDAAIRLAAVKAAINLRVGAVGSAQNIIESYGIHGRSVVYLPLRDLFALEASLVLAVKRESNPGVWGPTVEVRFGPVGSSNRGR